MSFLLALILACGNAFSQQAQRPLPEGVYRPGNGVTLPKLVSHTEPEYSEEARIGRLTGTFTISFIVGEDGAVRDVRPVTSLGLGLEEKAIEAVSSWRFNPGLKDGLPVAVAMGAEMNFQLPLRHGEWALSGALFAPAEGTSRPVLMAAPYPPAFKSIVQDGSITISFDVDENGLTANLHIEESSNHALENEVISVVREWRFNRALKTDGRCRFDARWSSSKEAGMHIAKVYPRLKKGSFYGAPSLIN